MRRLLPLVLVMGCGGPVATEPTALPTACSALSTICSCTTRARDAAALRADDTLAKCDTTFDPDYPVCCLKKDSASASISFCSCGVNMSTCEADEVSVSDCREASNRAARGLPPTSGTGGGGGETGHPP